MLQALVLERRNLDLYEEKSNKVRSGIFFRKSIADPSKSSFSKLKMRKKLFCAVLTAVTTVATVITSSPFLKPAKAEWDSNTLALATNALNIVWGEFVANLGITYYYPVVYTHPGPDTTPCGPLQLAHYCASSNTIHLDMSAMNSIASNVGDAAAYSILAHEYGHSVQQHLGLLVSGIPTPTLELQADCLSGAFFAASNYAGLIESGDLEEAMFSALSSGDYNYSDANHHGTPEQRVQAFQTGFATPDACF